MAHLYKRTGSPFWWIKYRDPATGKTVRESTGYRVGRRDETDKAFLKESEKTSDDWLASVVSQLRKERAVKLCDRVEDFIGQVVDCHDGGQRRIEAVSDQFIEYSVQIAPGTWMRLSPTRRGAVEADFIGAPIVEGVTPESKTLPQIAAEEGLKVLESDNDRLAACVRRWRDAFAEFATHLPTCRDFNNCDCGYFQLIEQADNPDLLLLPHVQPKEGAK